MKKVKLAIIGAGPAGYEAAFRAYALGMDVAIIEKDTLGGTCLNRGCIPTKTLVKSAEVARDVKDGALYGVLAKDVQMDAEKIWGRIEGVTRTLRKGVKHYLDVYKVHQYQGVASFLDEHHLKIETAEGVEELEFEYALIATGGQPNLPPIPGVEEEGVMTSDGILKHPVIPKRLGIIGAGVIGLEFASIFNAFGSEVTVFSDLILPQADHEVSKRMKSYLSRTGIRLHIGSRVQKIEKTEEGLRIYSDARRAKELDVDQILIATGRKPVLEPLNLEAAQVEYDKKGILTDEQGRTSQAHIFAAGDVGSGNVQLAHFASAQAVNIVDLIAGVEPTKNLEVVPSAVFTHPEMAMVGKTEQELKDQGIKYTRSKGLYSANGKALADVAEDGSIKLLEVDGKLVGAHIIGKSASDLIHLAAIGISSGLSMEDYQKTIFTHPTLSEVFQQAVMEWKN